MKAAVQHVRQFCSICTTTINLVAYCLSFGDQALLLKNTAQGSLLERILVDFVAASTKKSGTLSIILYCSLYHYEGVNYKAVAKFSKTIPCTNVPVHCPLCPTSDSGQLQIIWKYNAMYHLFNEHFIGDTYPPISRAVIGSNFNTKKQERALGYPATGHNKLEMTGMIFLTVKIFKLTCRISQLLQKEIDQT